MKKRTLAIFLSLALCLGSLSPVALAAEDGAPPEAEPQSCVCETACTDGNMDADCPVCGAEGAVPEVCGRHEEAKTEQTEPPSKEACTLTEGCTLPDGHEGECIVVPASSIVPVPVAGGTDGESKIEDKTFQVKTYDELKKAVDEINEADGGKFVIELTDDIQADGSSSILNFFANETTLLGNGHTLCTIYKMDPNVYDQFYIEVGTGATLNLGEDGDRNASALKITGGSNMDNAYAHSPLIRMSGGTLNIYDGVSLSDNTSMESGAAIAMISPATVNMYGGEIRDNTCNHQAGGGVCIFGGTFNMFGGTIAGNTCAELPSRSGGGVALVGYSGNFNMYGGTIEGNTAYDGGGVYINGGTLTVHGGEIKGNTAIYQGGGLHSDNRYAIMSIDNCTITNNSAGNAGGGLYIRNDQVVISNSIISENKATDNLGNSYGGGIVLTGQNNVFESVTIERNAAADYGGGVVLAYDQGAPMAYIRGRNTIQGNTSKDGKEDNFYLTRGSTPSYPNDETRKQKLTVTGPLTGSKIGITMAQPSNATIDPGTFTFGYNGYNTDIDPANYFTSDDPQYMVKYDDAKEAQLVKRPTAPLTVTVQDITAYTGGDSHSGDSFPTARYKVEAGDTVNLSEAAFTVGGEMYTLPEGTKSGDIVAIPLLDETFALQESAAAFANGAQDDRAAGEYEITVGNTDEVTALAADGTLLTLDVQPGTLTVRNVSDPDEVLDEGGIDTVATEIVTTEDAANTSSGMAVAVIPADAVFHTNGNEGLGLLGTEDEAAQISLLFDDLIARTDIIEGEGADTTKMLADHAAEKGYTLTEGQYQFKYLDLINEHDGNAWVSTDQDITIFWPYPDTVKANPENYTFELLHFPGLHREYDVETEEDLKALIAASEPESVQVEKTEQGVKFTLKGNLEHGSFSPFVLYWEEAEEPVVQHTVTFQPGEHGSLSGGTEADGSVRLAVADGTSLTVEQLPTATANSGYSFTGWLGSDGKTYIADGILALSITSDLTFTAQYKKDSGGSGGGGGGGGTTRYTIEAESNKGGSISPDGKVRVTRGSDKTFTITPADGYEIEDVLVDGKSVGAVSKYTFENVRKNHTIEAVFAASDSPDIPSVADPDDTGVSGWLNTTDHRAFLNGYANGTFGPDRNMTRAEVAQMFYNLLLNKDVPVTVQFTDVPMDAWYKTAVDTLASLGIVQGVGNSQFAPDRPITRAEFTVIAMRFADLDARGVNTFSDVSEDDWFYAQVVGSIKYGWITGYTDGTFRPNNTITRAEVTTITNRMLGRAADEDFVDRHADELRQFPDVDKSYWAYDQIMEAANAHDYTVRNGVEDWRQLQK